MRIIFLVIASLLLAVLDAAGQGGNSIVRHVVINGTTSGATYAVPNIGQVQHQVLATASGTPGVCIATQQIFLQGTADNSNWVDIGPVLSVDFNNNVPSGNIFASGLFPAFRIKVIGNGACVLNVWYVGTVASFNAPQAVMNVFNYNTLAIASGASVGGTTGVVAVPPVGTSSAIPVVYGIVAYQSDTANVYEYVLQSADSLGCTAPVGPKISFKLGTGATNFTLPSSLVPYLVGGSGKGLCITGKSAAGTTNATITLIMRFEGGA